MSVIIPSLTIVARGVDYDRLKAAVLDAARVIAEAIDDGVTDFDVDVVEGTWQPFEPLHGDTIEGYGRRDEEQTAANERRNA